MNKKAEQLQKFFEEQKITGFQVHELQDDEHSVVFNSNLVVDGNQLPFGIRITDTAINQIQIRVAENVPDDKMQAVLELINKYNRNFKVSRVHVAPNKELVMEIWPVDKPDELDGSRYTFFISIIQQQLAGCYKEIMKTLWD